MVERIYSQFLPLVSNIWMKSEKSDFFSNKKPSRTRVLYHCGYRPQKKNYSTR